MEPKSDCQFFLQKELIFCSEYALLSKFSVLSSHRIHWNNPFWKCSSSFGLGLPQIVCALIWMQDECIKHPFQTFLPKTRHQHLLLIPQSQDLYADMILIPRICWEFLEKWPPILVTIWFQLSYGSSSKRENCRYQYLKNCCYLQSKQKQKHTGLNLKTESFPIAMVECMCPLCCALPQGKSLYIHVNFHMQMHLSPII